ncbi:MAG: hypothetical protein WBD63_04680 [Phycisphaerae bacterium]
MAARYSHFTHRHHFAAWAAARASQRRWGVKTTAIVAAIESSGLSKLVAGRRAWPNTIAAFDRTHRDICRRIAERVQRKANKKSTFGHAAKVVAVYLKSMVILGPEHDSAFARLAHPPIDRILLKAIAGDVRLDMRLRRMCRDCNWTELNEDGYYGLIAELRKHGLDKPSFWMLERYWDPRRSR